MGWLLLLIDAGVLIGLISAISDDDVNIRTALGIAFGAALGVNGLARVLIPTMGLWGLIIAANVIGLLVGVLISALYGAEIKRSFSVGGIFVLVHICGSFLLYWLQR